MFHKILIANRGEIALRIIRTCRELGIRTVIAHSTADAHSLPVRVADESICVGPDDARASYLNLASIISAAVVTDSEAIHPGYGFLAENAAFADICRACGLTFIGPSPEAIRLMGDKAQARVIARQAGVPVVPGSELPLKDEGEAADIADAAGYPVIFKAAAGGGGRGMRIVRSRPEVAQAFAACQAEAGAAFGSSEIYCEKYIQEARHVEVQVLGDKNGIRVHLGERDCSVQRRHQKLIEESPAPAVDPELREKIGKIGTDAARAVGYRSAGTIEGLLQDGEYFFLEMNTRVQVEHCVTEMVTGIDIVREQIKIAAGEPLAYGQEDVVVRGHAIECRINAEDASKNFAPAPGRIGSYIEPSGPFVRVDSGAEEGYEVLPLYDPMIAKLIVWDVDRLASTKRMLRALGEYEIGGLKTLIPFHRALLATEQWANAETCRDLVEDKAWLKELAFPAPEEAAGEDEPEKVAREYAVEVSGRRFDVTVIGEALVANGAGPAAGPKKAPRRERKSSGGEGAPGELVSPIQGTVLKVAVEKGAEVDEGALICVIEAMKMENEITAPSAGTVEELSVSEGGSVATGDSIAVIK
jgi:acetyl-CoA/propionyl-CoA/long-chain acyl-CoA carboxylase, biotin carboxylase, biotin carboxyl carrier protein